MLKVYRSDIYSLDIWINLFKGALYSVKVYAGLLVYNYSSLIDVAFLDLLHEDIIYIHYGV